MTLGVIVRSGTPVHEALVWHSSVSSCRLSARVIRGLAVCSSIRPNNLSQWSHNIPIFNFNTDSHVEISLRCKLHPPKIAPNRDHGVRGVIEGEVNAKPLPPPRKLHANQRSILVLTIAHRHYLHKTPFETKLLWSRHYNISTHYQSFVLCGLPIPANSHNLASSHSSSHN